MSNSIGATPFDLSDWIDGDSRPGAVIGVLSRGVVQFWAARGQSGLGSNETPLTPSTVFYIASVSKQFTAACVTLCELDGSLNVDAPIRALLPELPDPFEQVTIRHLLHHLGGLPQGWDLNKSEGQPWWDNLGLGDSISVLAKLERLPQPPGAGYSYSNAGYWLLAAGVERATGVRFSDFARQRLFAPLGMSNTRFRDDPDVPQPDLAMGHATVDGSLVPYLTRFHCVGDGGLLTNLDDLAKWDLFWSGRSSLGGDLPTRLLERGRRDDGASIYYARGVSVRTHRGLRIISHGGSFIGYLAKLVRFPDQDFSIACLSNADDVDVDGLSMAVADAVLGSAVDPDAPNWMQTVREDALDT